MVLANTGKWGTCPASLGEVVAAFLRPCETFSLLCHWPFDRGGKPARDRQMMLSFKADASKCEQWAHQVCAATRVLCASYTRCGAAMAAVVSLDRVSTLQLCGAASFELLGSVNLSHLQAVRDGSIAAEPDGETLVASLQWPRGRRGWSAGLYIVRVDVMVMERKRVLSRPFSVKGLTSRSIVGWDPVGLTALLVDPGHLCLVRQIALSWEFDDPACFSDKVAWLESGVLRTLCLVSFRELPAVSVLDTSRSRPQKVSKAVCAPGSMHIAVMFKVAAPGTWNLVLIDPAAPEHSAGRLRKTFDTVAAGLGWGLAFTMHGSALVCHLHGQVFVCCPRTLDVLYTFRPAALGIIVVQLPILGSACPIGKYADERGCARWSSSSMTLKPRVCMAMQQAGPLDVVEHSLPFRACRNQIREGC